LDLFAQFPYFGGIAMLRIAIVEDDDATRSQLGEYVHRCAAERGFDIKLDSFPDSRIVQDYVPSYDIIFLDIRLPGINGMDLARTIRTADPHVVLVFVTNMAQYAIQGYSVDALDFLLKPIHYETFSLKLCRAVQRVRRNAGGQISVQTSGGVQILDTDDIYYLETLNRMLYYHTAGGTLSSRASLQSVERQLAPYHFARCNQCYLVNLRYVTGVEGDKVLVGGAALEISRRNKNSFMDSLAGFVGGLL